MLYLWLCYRGRFATFGSGPQGEMYWPGFSASPDARAEGAPVTTEAAHLCPSTSLKKVRPYFLIWWCCSMYKAFSQCWVRGAASGVRHLPGNWCWPESHWYHGQEWFCCAPGFCSAPSCPVPCCLACSCCCETATFHDFNTHMKMLYLPKCKQWDACD